MGEHKKLVALSIPQPCPARHRQNPANLITGLSRRLNGRMPFRFHPAD
jgi:hypothetical protein